ncbi:calcium-binding protein [Roseivivax sediminis]|uniref:Hemolysin-type calcium-binding repeat-containing protein n=1 Tax=Roseivivax sediminis TaxID=936889 RepID=A0A1I2ACK9_9RHOB|nr:calcium-binding protein [Roseivivax sediminis]SFE41745.1 Hemolysin-type calcium-binding repeat-containing protein [Roseivivax sediminis]
MQITYFGPTVNVVGDAFVSNDNLFEPDVGFFSATEIVLQNPDTGMVSTLTGSGFATDDDGEPAAGTISAITFAVESETVATFTGLTWGLVDFVAALDSAIEADDTAQLSALFSQDGTVEVDAAGAISRFDMDDLEDVFLGVTQPVDIVGSAFDDELIGGRTGDTIDPGTNTGYDRLHATPGNDLYTFAQAAAGSYYEIEYDYIPGPVTVSVDTGAGTASVTDGTFTDSFAAFTAASTAEGGGFGVVGSGADDRFDLTLTAGHWVPVSGGAGDDRFDLDLGEDAFLRIFYSWDGVDGPQTGIVADMGAGTIEDGLGGTDTITRSGPGGLEIGGTDFADTLTGGEGDDFFIPRGGNDSIDGGGGFDRVRYDTNGVGAVTVDLATGSASGSRNGSGFIDTLASIEYLRGSAEGDTILGGDASERLLGRAGDDSIAGRGGDDDLRGEAGNDTILGGAGNDTIEDGAGDDSVNGGAGDDVIEAGTGADTFAGGAGRDELRYTLPDAEAGDFVVVADLAAGTGGLQGDPAEADDLSGIEDVTFVGAVSAVLTGNGGDNRLVSGSGADTLTGGGGRDVLIGGAGDDLIDAATGRADSQGFGDYVRPGIGSNTVIGHEAAFALGGGRGLDLSYADIDDVGGVTVTIGANGSGTSVATNGEVNDTFTFVDYVEGTQQGDVLTGSDLDEGFAGQDGADTIDGGGGFDILYMQADGVFGTAGETGVTVNVAAGTAIDASGATDTFSNIEEVRGTSAGDRMVATGYAADIFLRGGAGDDTLRGGNGDDLIDGDAGDDTAVIGLALTEVRVSEAQNGDIVLTSALGEDSYRAIESFVFTDGARTAADLLETMGGGGGTQGEVIIGTDGPDTLTGTDDDDRVAGGAGDDNLDGGAGNDGVLGEGGSDTLLGGAGDDNISGSTGDDVIDGGPGDDFIGGGPGNDTVTGSTGNDTVGGGQGNDSISTNAGDDVIAGGPGDDLLEGGAGDDTIGGSFGADNVRGNAGDDSLGGGTGMDSLVGGAGADSIGGGEGNDVVVGGDGNDFLAGGGRNDTVDGGAGADTLNGGDGDDLLTGGIGADRFVWTSGETGAVDTIADFQDGVDTLFLVGVENAPGTGLAGKLDTLAISDVTVAGASAAQLSYDGQSILLLGVAAEDIGLDDIAFL